MFVIIDVNNGCYKKVKEFNVNEIDFAEWELMRECPVCGRMYWEYPALSRRDNKTYICPECGRREAIEDFVNSRKEEGIPNEND